MAVQAFKRTEALTMISSIAAAPKKGSLNEA